MPATLRVMKTTSNILSSLIAAGAPGVALLALSDRVPADLALAGLTAIGLVAFAIFDYSRPTHELKVPGGVVRPMLPAASAPVSLWTLWSTYLFVVFMCLPPFCVVGLTAMRVWIGSSGSNPRLADKYLDFSATLPAQL